MTQPAFLSVRHLTVEFQTRRGTLRAVDDVSFTLAPGEVLGIVGESGAGKSLTAAALIRLLEPPGRIASGEVHLKGTRIDNLAPEALRRVRGKRIGMVFQDPLTSLNPLYTIGEQLVETIRSHTDMSETQARAKAISLLEDVGIPAAARRIGAYPHEFSGGMRQRVVIAIAMACKPRILICDEPTTALDVTIQAQILGLIKALQKDFGFTTIYITHDLGVVADVADRVAVMYAGKLVECGSAEEVFYDPRHPYTWALLSSLPQLGVKGQALYSISGTPPNLFNEVKGDAFAPRNPRALKIDFLEEPPAFAVSPTHWAATWLLDPRAPRVEPPAAIAAMRAKYERSAS